MKCVRFVALSAQGQQQQHQPPAHKPIANTAMTWPMCSSIFPRDDARTLFVFIRLARRSINDVLIIFCEFGGYPRSFCFGVRLQSSRCCGGPCGATRLPHLQSNDVCSAHCIDATVRHRAVGRGCAPGIQSLLA